MNMGAGRIFRKTLRTLQSFFPFAQPIKQDFYDYFRRLTAHPHDEDFKALAMFNPSSLGVYVDIGANHGQSISSIRLFRPVSNIVAFEPNPNLALKLKTKYENNSLVDIRSTGLGDEKAEMILFVPSYRGFIYDGLASLDRSEAVNWINSKTVYHFDASKLTVDEIKCRISTLDDENLEPAFIKIDVQGFEYHTLKGSENTIRAFEPIILIEDYNGDGRSVELMTELGYSEYYYKSGKIIRGRSLGSNSFLMTARRASAEGL